MAPRQPETSAPPNTTHAAGRPSRRALLAGAIGNILEWYDFGLYGLLAPVLARLFFPGQSHLAALLEVYGGFAAGFAMRPLGAVVLGRWGDRIGRRFVLVVSVALMGAATVAIGVLPSYAVIGLWAPVLLIVIRLFQGFSVGGEFVGSVTYLVEVAEPRRRGLTGSLANIGSTVGMLLAAGAAALAAAWAGPRLLEGWAWRAPFLAGGILALAGYLLRRHLPEPERRGGEAPAARAKPVAEAGGASRRQAPLGQALREAPRLMLLITLFTSGYGIADYLTMVFLPTFAHTWGHFPLAEVLRINTVGQAVALAVVPLAGWISDRFLRRGKLLTLAFAGVAVFAWEGFALAGQGSSGGLWLAQLGFAALFALMMGTAPAMLAEQFPPEYRVTGHAVAFNVGIGMAGGTAPLVALALIHASGIPMMAAGYLIFAAVLAAVTVGMLPDRSRDSLL
jgi:MHS family proline/betaine transporter-like MFS transporter